MPVRLTKPWNGQPAGTMYWGADQATLRETGGADDDTQNATDYVPFTRDVTAATATASVNATTYRMNSATAQTLTIPMSGYWPQGTALTVIQAGAGATTLAGATGVALVTKNAGLVTSGQNSVAQLLKIGPNTWEVVGATGA